MSAEQPLPPEETENRLAEVIPFPRNEGNIIFRIGGAILDAAKIVLLGPDYTDKN